MANENSNTTNPTLGDLFNLDDDTTEVKPPVDTLITDGDGTGVPDLQEEADRQAAEDAAAAEGGDDPEGAGDPPAPEEGDDLTPEQFYATVDQLYGEDINQHIDYGENDPLSPQGVYAREQYIAQRAAQHFENSLKEGDPRAYAYFLHRQNGGSDEEFYSRQTTVLPPLQEVKDSVDLQRKVYEQGLLARGNSLRQVDALLRVATEAGELGAEAEAAWNELKGRETSDLTKAEEANSRIVAKQQADLSDLDGLINTSVSSGEGLKFIIPEADKNSFTAAFKKLVHYENGEFFMVKPLSAKNLNKVMEAELFEFLNGDLKKLVEKKATTISSRRILGKARNQNAPKGEFVPTKSQTLGDII